MFPILPVLFTAQPSAAMAMTAITGTNGKTTCSRLLAELLEALPEGCRPWPQRFIGTMGYGMVRDTGYRALHDAAISAASGITDTGLTTPDAVAMQRILAELRSKGASNVALEVSSHSLVQRRVAGLQINTAVFTNLSRDHLDYHGDLIPMLRPKHDYLPCRVLQHAVINIDDAVGRLILANLDPDIQVDLAYSSGRYRSRCLLLAPLAFPPRACVAMLLPPGAG